ncbi:DUF47 domain-containing protein [Chloroflexota bacterium]
MVKVPFIPREQKFFDLFEESARNMVQASSALKEMVNNWEYVDAKVAEITELEHGGDIITHQIMAQVNRTFVTPFDREDIVLLSQTMDDVVDFVKATADAMLIYKISHPTQKARELTNILVQATAEVERAVGALRRQADLKQINDRCVEINRLENMGDRVFRLAMAELFDDAVDMAEVIKWREIYEHMEGATDRCEDLADVLEGVVLKHT